MTTTTTGAGRQSWVGIACVTGSAVSFSTAGLFTGLIQADAWTMLVWRGVFGGLAIGSYVVWLRGAATLGAIRAVGWPGLAVGACSTVGTVCFIHALRLTTVAEATIIFATAPFIAAALAWLWMRERPAPATLGASLLALGGVLVMAGPAPGGDGMAGNLLALAMTTLIATMTVIIRRYRDIFMLPASGLSAFACAIVALPFAAPLRLSGQDMILLAAFGIVQFGLGLMLLTLGSRLISASRTALLSNIELPLAPLWVWLAFGVLPSSASWWGGAVVVLALLLDIAAGRRRARPVPADRDAIA